MRASLVWCNGWCPQLPASSCSSTTCSAETPGPFGTAEVESPGQERNLLMKTALIGATGFVGSYVVDALLSRGHEVRLLVRPGSEHRAPSHAACEIVAGDVEDAEAVARLMNGCEAAAYLIGILREAPERGITFDALQRAGAERAIDLARSAGVTRFALMSANGVEARRTPYQETKWQAERYLADSGLAGVALRPSVIFGDPHGRLEFCTELRDQIVTIVREGQVR